MDPAYFLEGATSLTNNVTEGWHKQILKANNEEESLWAGNMMWTIMWPAENTLQTIQQSNREVVLGSRKSSNSFIACDIYQN